MNIYAIAARLALAGTLIAASVAASAHRQTCAEAPLTLLARPTVITTTVEIPSGVELDIHKHPHQRIAIVREGSLRVTNAETGEVREFHQGDVIVELVDVWHSGKNIGRTPVRLTVMDIVPAGVTSNTMLRPAPPPLDPTKSQ